MQIAALHACDKKTNLTLKSQIQIHHTFVDVKIWLLKGYFSDANVLQRMISSSTYSHEEYSLSLAYGNIKWSPPSQSKL